MKHDTAITWNWFRMNVPTIIAIAGVGLYINNGLIDAKRQAEILAQSMKSVQEAVAPLNNLEYRLTRAEAYLGEAHKRIDGLSNTMINNVDLIRRDVNRLTTRVEVLSTQIGMYLGEDPDPAKKRISRPGGPVDPD